jgi:hypothetical protein
MLKKMDVFIDELKAITNLQRDFAVRMLSFEAQRDRSHAPEPMASTFDHRFNDFNNQFDEIANDDFGEKQIETVKIVKKESYPFNKFINDLNAPSLKNIKAEFMKFRKMSNGMDPVAYYLFENRELSDGVRKQFIRVFRSFAGTKMEYTPANIKVYLLDLDIQEAMTHSTLAVYYTKLTQIGVTSYGYNKDDFTSIKFASKKSSHERRHAATKKEMVLQAIETLEKKHQYEYGLLLKLMWTFAARPCEMLYLCFENFDNSEGQ